MEAADRSAWKISLPDYCRLFYQMVDFRPAQMRERLWLVDGRKDHTCIK